MLAKEQRPREAALAPSQQSVSLDQDDVVIVNVDEVLPPDLGADGEPKPTPPWRGREMRAVVLMLPHTTNGQRGVAMRRGDGFEPQYRVRLLAPVSRDYAPECALADEAVRLRELAKNGGIDPKKRMVAAGGGTSSDLIEERRDAWMRDRRLARAQQGRSSESTHEQRACSSAQQSCVVACSPGVRARACVCAWRAMIQQVKIIRHGAPVPKAMPGSRTIVGTPPFSGSCHGNAMRTMSPMSTGSHVDCTSATQSRSITSSTV